MWIMKVKFDFDFYFTLNSFLNLNPNFNHILYFYINLIKDFGFKLLIK